MSNRRAWTLTRSASFDVALFGDQTSSKLENVGKLKPEAQAKQCGRTSIFARASGFNASTFPDSFREMHNIKKRERGRTFFPTPPSLALRVGMAVFLDRSVFLRPFIGGK